MNATLLKPLEYWQKAIVLHLIEQPESLSADPVIITRHLLLALLWLQLCQQRGITVDYPRQKVLQGDRYLQFLDQLQQVSERLGWSFPLLLPNSLPNCDVLLQSCMDSLQQVVHTSSGSSHLLGQVYEQSLSWVGTTRLRKTGGVYYTPEPIVNFVMAQTVDAILQKRMQLASATPLRILDPACGGGIFLLAAYQRLLDWYLQAYLAVGKRARETATGAFVSLDCQLKHQLTHQLIQGTDGQWRLTQAERSRILQTHIYGVDVDPQAVAVTRLSLYLKLLEDGAEFCHQPLPDLSHNICCGDAIVNRAQGFTWEKDFSQILQTGGFEAVLGNPPYVDSEQMSLHSPDCRHYCSQHYRSATGNWDLFCVFVEKAIDLCRPGGLVSLVVPNKLASASYAKPVRQMLSQENQLLAIRDYSQVAAFAAAVYPIVFVMRKLDPQLNKSPEYQSPVRYELMQTLHQVQHSRSVILPACSVQQSWQFTSSPRQSSLLARLQRDFPTLGDIAQVRGAATVSEAYQLQRLILNNPVPAVASGDLQLVNSGTIDRYRFLWGEKPLRYLGQVYLHPTVMATQSANLPAKRYQQSRQPKIIVAGLTQRLECAFDPVGAILAGKSTSIIWLEPEAQESIDLRYLLGLLNSQLLSAFFRSVFGGNQLQDGYLRVGPPQLRSLPICLPNLRCDSDRRDYQQLIEWVEQRLACASLSIGPQRPQPHGELEPRLDVQLDLQIDRLVAKLYRFTDAEMDEITTPALFP